MTEPPPIKICAQCRRVLDYYTTAEGKGYRHSFQDLEAGHAPEPILMPADYREGRCDFCNQDRPAFHLPVRDFRMLGHGDTVIYNSQGDWAACATCAALIKDNGWEDLFARVVLSRVARGRPLSVADRELVAALYRELQVNILGALRRLP